MVVNLALEAQSLFTYLPVCDIDEIRDIRGYSTALLTGIEPVLLP